MKKNLIINVLAVVIGLFVLFEASAQSPKPPKKKTAQEALAELPKTEAEQKQQCKEKMDTELNIKNSGIAKAVDACDGKVGMTFCIEKAKKNYQKKCIQNIQAKIKKFKDMIEAAKKKANPGS